MRSWGRGFGREKNGEEGWAGVVYFGVRRVHEPTVEGVLCFWFGL